MKWAFLASVGFFSQVPPPHLTSSPSGTDGTENFEQKFREKTLPCVDVTDLIADWLHFASMHIFNQSVITL